MRALLQRVSQASVTVDEEVVGQIGRGLLVLLGVGQDDSEAQVKTLADKIVHLRIFADDEGNWQVPFLLVMLSIINLRRRVAVQLHGQ